jgi:hypothetical protein
LERLGAAVAAQGNRDYFRSSPEEVPP